MTRCPVQPMLGLGAAQKPASPVIPTVMSPGRAALWMNQKVATTSMLTRAAEEGAHVLRRVTVMPVIQHTTEPHAVPAPEEQTQGRVLAFRHSRGVPHTKLHACRSPLPQPLPRARERGDLTRACTSTRENGHAVSLLSPLPRAGEGPGVGCVLRVADRAQLWTSPPLAHALHVTRDGVVLSLCLVPFSNASALSS